MNARIFFTLWTVSVY